MSDLRLTWPTPRQVCRLAGIWLLVWLPVAVSAQTLGGPRAAPTAPRNGGVLTGFRTTLDFTHLISGSDVAPFNWDLDMLADLDLFDLGFLRGNMLGNFETIIGNEKRSVDPNQANYTVDLTAFIRLPRGELGTTIHHVSRHLIDRATDDSVSWNMVGVSYGDRFSLGRFALEAGARGMGTVERAGVDYDGQFEGYVKMARPVGHGLAIIASAEGVVVPVEREIQGRDTMRGGRVEAGLRLLTRGSSVDVYVAWEQRIDAEVSAPGTIRWTQVGFRLATSVP